MPGVKRRQVTAIVVVRRCALLGVRAQATDTTTAVLDELQDRFPFPVQAIPVDGGAGVMAGLGDACEAQGIARSVLPLLGPTRNGRVERRNGTVRREVWADDDGEMDLPTLVQTLCDKPSNPMPPDSTKLSATRRLAPPSVSDTYRTSTVA